MNTKRDRNIAFGSALLTRITGIGVITISLFSLHFNKCQVNSAAMASHRGEVLVETERVLSLTKDVESGGRGYIITAESQYLENFRIALSAIPVHLQKLKSLSTGQLQPDLVDSLFAAIQRNCMAEKYG